MPIDYKGRKYNVVPYDPKWKDRFVEEAKLLNSIFGASAIAIEHIGSTAVSGLVGKPTIDILILVENIAIVDVLNQKMESAGFKALGEYVMPGARLFVKEVNGNRLCNVHVFPKKHLYTKEMLQLRDYLRNHLELIKEYSKLKFDLQAKYPNDYGLYRKHKDKWMEKLKEKMKKEFSISK